MGKLILPFDETPEYFKMKGDLTSVLYPKNLVRNISTYRMPLIFSTVPDTVIGKIFKKMVSESKGAIYIYSDLFHVGYVKKDFEIMKKVAQELADKCYTVQMERNDSYGDYYLEGDVVHSFGY
jgi:hypothetical protein